MPELTPLQLEDGTTIYIQTRETSPTPKTSPLSSSSEKLDFIINKPQSDNVPRGINPIKSIQNLQNTIRGYTLHPIKSFQNLATAEVKEVTLEFGVNAGGDGGIPYIATGNAECNVKVTVTCVFPKTSD